MKNSLGPVLYNKTIGVVNNGQHVENGVTLVVLCK
jgi:hypothetical protein